MGSPLVISQLTRRYAKLLGAYRAADRYVESFEGLKAIQEATRQIDEYKLELKQQMSEIAGAIRQFDPAFKIESIRPIRPKKQQFAYRRTHRYSKWLMAWRAEAFPPEWMSDLPAGEKKSLQRSAPYPRRTSGVRRRPPPKRTPEEYREMMRLRRG